MQSGVGRSCRFPLVDQLLDRGLAIAAHADQFLLRVFQIVLVKRELRLRDADQVLQIFLRSADGVRGGRRELRDPRLIRGRRGGCRLHARSKLLRLRGKRHGIFRRIVQRRGKRQIDGMIAQPQGLHGVILLHVGNRQRR